jgi:hypothetical protein
MKIIGMVTVFVLYSGIAYTMDEPAQKRSRVTVEQPAPNILVFVNGREKIENLADTNPSLEDFFLQVGELYKTCESYLDEKFAHKKQLRELLKTDLHYFYLCKNLQLVMEVNFLNTVNANNFFQFDHSYDWLKEYNAQLYKLHERYIIHINNTYSQDEYEAQLAKNQANLKFFRLQNNIKKVVIQYLLS